MDNLTHSLIGAALGQAGLKRKTGLGMPTLIIAANIPDIDATCALLGTVSLAMRRGVTHGPIARLVLPLLLTGAMLAWDRSGGRGRRSAESLPVRPGWLLALAYIGCLSHPLFDWMNSYGIRLLEPFSHRWFYGDALFIVDPWLWAILGAGIWLSRRRERGDAAFAARPARVAIVAAAAYVLANLGISAQAAARVRGDAPYPRVVVANPVPFAFWRRAVLWREGGRYGAFDVALLGDKRASVPARPIGMDDPRIAAQAARDPAAGAFLFWSRMPIARREGDAIVLGDQRFADSLAGSRFQVRLER